MMPLTRVRLVTLVVGGGGLVVGMAIYLLAAPPPEDPLQDFQNTKAYEQSVERFGGRAAVFGGDVQTFLSSATHGPNLGLTIAALSVVVAGIYYLRATRRLEEAEEETVTHP